MLFPQVPDGEYWSEPIIESVFATLPVIRAKLGLDSTRTYFTGISMGGNGVLRALKMKGSQITAAIVACGFIEAVGETPGISPESPTPFEDLANELTGTPLWLFHGSQDPVVEPAQSRRLFDAMLRHQNLHVRYTEAADRRHGVWDLAFADSVLDWLLEQRGAE